MNVVLNVFVLVTESFDGVVVILVNAREFEASQQIVYREGFGGSID